MMVSEGFAIVYDLADPYAWRQAHAHRHLWGRRFCEHYVLDEEHLLIVFVPAGERWRSWEAHRESWILGTREHARFPSEASGAEAAARKGPAGRCPECGLLPDGRGCIVLIDEADPERSFQGDPQERCTRCGLPLYTAIEVVYEDAEGEGL